MTKKQKSQSKPMTSKIHQTSDIYFTGYQMAKELYLEELTDEDLPANQRLPKDVAKRLALSVGDVTVEPFDDEEGAVCIKLKIRGSEQDIDKLNKVLQARDDSVEQEDKETTETN